MNAPPMNAIDQANLPEPIRTATPGGSDTVAQRVLIRLQIILEIPSSTTKPYWTSLQEASGSDEIQQLIEASQQSGIFLKEIDLVAVDDVCGFVRNGYPVLFVESSGDVLVLERGIGRKLEGTEINSSVETRAFTRRQLRQRLRADPPPRLVVAKKELECDQMSAAPVGTPHDDHDDHPTPLRRFLTLLSLDRRDILTVFLFAFVAGVLALASPLAVESLVNVVSWGTYVQPLLILAAMLLISSVMAVAVTVTITLLRR